MHDSVHPKICAKVDIHVVFLMFLHCHMHSLLCFILLKISLSSHLSSSVPVLSFSGRTHKTTYLSVDCVIKQEFEHDVHAVFGGQGSGSGGGVTTIYFEKHF